MPGRGARQAPCLILTNAVEFAKEFRMDFLSQHEKREQRACFAWDTKLLVLRPRLGLCSVSPILTCGPVIPIVQFRDPEKEASTKSAKQPSPNPAKGA
jgi:hypothetical protein